ncbi:hypothetical protein [Actinophytocola oryzae]|uniref:Uncharacterized protein n=1 Tax=Actinophytocola oryzae TaxID=502181 RepID=A0A4R7VBC3_9PSEU|nr:hypothetical protein [Actinophytocola oryzae]TDV46340.1 hypothetical protein CLV71_111299 [Actinophytocola oryzae]
MTVTAGEGERPAFGAVAGGHVVMELRITVRRLAGRNDSLPLSGDEHSTLTVAVAQAEGTPA